VVVVAHGKEYEIHDDQVLEAEGILHL